MKKENPLQPDEEIILLEDLVPRHSVKGGTGKLVFGQFADLAGEADSPPVSPHLHLLPASSSSSLLGPDFDPLAKTRPQGGQR